jgi:hypothetical protein
MTNKARHRRQEVHVAAHRQSEGQRDQHDARVLRVADRRAVANQAEAQGRAEDGGEHQGLQVGPYARGAGDKG